MGDRTFHIRQVWLSTIMIKIKISDMGSETREKHGETMEKQGEAREKVLSAKRGKTQGEESRCRSPASQTLPSKVQETCGCLVPAVVRIKDDVEMTVVTTWSPFRSKFSKLLTNSTI